MNIIEFYFILSISNLWDTGEVSAECTHAFLQFRNTGFNKRIVDSPNFDVGRFIDEKRMVSKDTFKNLPSLWCSAHKDGFQSLI